MKVKTKQLRICMCEKIMNPSELSEAAGLSKTAVAAVLKRGTCSLKTIGRIAKVLDVHPSELVDFDL